MPITTKKKCRYRCSGNVNHYWDITCYVWKCVRAKFREGTSTKLFFPSKFKTRAKVIVSRIQRHRILVRPNDKKILRKLLRNNGNVSKYNKIFLTLFIKNRRECELIIDLGAVLWQTNTSPSSSGQRKVHDVIPIIFSINIGSGKRINFPCFCTQDSNTRLNGGRSLECFFLYIQFIIRVGKY